MTKEIPTYTLSEQQATELEQFLQPFVEAGSIFPLLGDKRNQLLFEKVQAHLSQKIESALPPEIQTAIKRLTEQTTEPVLLIKNVTTKTNNLTTTSYKSQRPVLASDYFSSTMAFILAQHCKIKFTPFFRDITDEKSRMDNGRIQGRQLHQDGDLFFSLHGMQPNTSAKTSITTLNDLLEHMKPDHIDILMDKNNFKTQNGEKFAPLAKNNKGNLILSNYNVIRDNIVTSEIAPPKAILVLFNFLEATDYHASKNNTYEATVSTGDYLIVDSRITMHETNSYPPQDRFVTRMGLIKSQIQIPQTLPLNTSTEELLHGIRAANYRAEHSTEQAHSR